MLPFASVSKRVFMRNISHELQNCAARLILGGGKYDHITPLLRELHWLPVEHRINFKLLLITLKLLII